MALTPISIFLVEPSGARTEQWLFWLGKQLLERLRDCNIQNRNFGEGKESELSFLDNYDHSSKHAIRRRRRRWTRRPQLQLELRRQTTSGFPWYRPKWQWSWCRSCVGTDMCGPSCGQCAPPLFFFLHTWRHGFLRLSSRATLESAITS